MKRISVIVFALALVLLVGCSGGEFPETAVSNYLTAIQSSNFENVKKYDENLSIYGEGFNFETTEASELFFDNLSFEIISSSVSSEGKNAIVNVKITNKDFASVTLEVFGKILEDTIAGEKQMSNEEVDKLFEEITHAKHIGFLTQSVEIILNKTDNGWAIIASDDLKNAVFGGMISAADEINSLAN